eukprot:633513-Rhodomonas_salina.1
MGTQVWRWKAGACVEIWRWRGQCVLWIATCRCKASCSGCVGVGVGGKRPARGQQQAQQGAPPPSSPPRPPRTPDPATHAHTPATHSHQVSLPHQIAATHIKPAPRTRVQTRAWQRRVYRTAGAWKGVDMKGIVAQRTAYQHMAEQHKRQQRHTRQQCITHPRGRVSTEEHTLASKTWMQAEAFAAARRSTRHTHQRDLGSSLEELDAVLAALLRQRIPHHLPAATAHIHASVVSACTASTAMRSRSQNAVTPPSTRARAACTPLNQHEHDP